jgi:porin
LPHRHLRPQWETRGNPAIEFAQASEPTTDQEAVGDVTPNPNRGDGGKAATGRIIRQLQTERLKTLKAKPKTGDPVQDWLDGPSILGEWGGYRQRLEDRGITFGGFSANAFLTNATGGNRRSWAYTNLTMAAADLEFERLVGLPGFLVHTEMAAAAGNNLSSRSRIGQSVQRRHRVHAERPLTEPDVRAAAALRRCPHPAARAPDDDEQLCHAAGIR